MGGKGEESRGVASEHGQEEKCQRYLEDLDQHDFAGVAEVDLVFWMDGLGDTFDDVHGLELGDMA